jgi:hypothetical protein
MKSIGWPLALREAPMTQPLEPVLAAMPRPAWPTWSWFRLKPVE